ncbi:unnamed protein product [Schistosoma turkestanicum]|nr:unnamed protein product [Schistosoma turkestanicum]
MNSFFKRNKDKNKSFYYCTVKSFVILIQSHDCLPIELIYAKYPLDSVRIIPQLRIQYINWIHTNHRRSSLHS